MNSKRIFYVMNGLIVLLIFATIGSTYVALQQFKKQAVKLNDYKLQYQVLEQEQVGLAKAKKDIATYSSLEKIAKTVVPQDKDQAKAVREIIKIAADSGIKPTSITFPASTLGSIVPSGVAAPATTPAPAPAAGAVSKKSLSQLVPLKDIPGVYNLKITIQQEASSPVPYAKFIDFLSRLEQNRRTAHVTGIVLQPTPQNRDQVSFTLTVDEFIKP